jgi:exonuclease SbcC
MSQGRYAIEHSDERTRGGKRTGLEILVYDAHTGVSRSPRSLSGGEKFLASLALALGLAEVVTNRAGGIQLDTLFIDEGFGALDNETLELAMHTLDELRQGGRTVGLISHVEAMKDQIPAKLLVGVADGGWSEIIQDSW